MNPELKIITPVDLKDSEIEKLKEEIQYLKGRIGFESNRARTFQWNMLALKDSNRYFASQKLGRPASNLEAYWHFINHGGKDAFDKTHP